MSGKKNSPPDLYYEKLPGILAETENEVKRLRGKLRSQAKRSLALFFVLALLFLGVAGSGCYFGIKWHNKEVKNAVALALEGKEEKPKEEENNEPEKGEEEDVTEDEENAETEIPEEIPEAIPMDEAFTYSSETREFFLNLNGKKLSIPVSAKDLEIAGWEMLGEEEVDENTLRSIFIDEAGGSLSFYHDKSTQALKSTSNVIEVVFDVEGLNLLSLGNKSTEIDVARLFSGAEKANGDNYFLDTKTGTVIYSYGEVDVTVTISNGLVTGLKVAKVR